LGATALVRAGAAVVGLERDEPKQVAAVLHFPGDLVAPQVRTVLDGVAGLPRGAVVALGMLAEPSGITFELSGAASQLTVIERTLAGTAPGVRLDALAASAAARRQPGPATRGARLSWQGAYPLLRTDEPESTIGALLGTVSQLRQGERLWLQLALTPAGRVPLPAATDSGSDDLAQLLGAPRHVPREQRRAVVAKFHLPLLRARIMLAVQAGHPSRAEQLITRVAGVLRTRSGMRGGLRVRRLPAGRLLPSWSRPPRGGDLLSSAELIALVGWPIGAPALPGLNYGVAPRLLPPAAIPSEGAGRVFGVSNWPGQERRRLIQPPSGARCHSLLLGPSGSGKSWLLANLFLGQLAAGEGAVLLDLKGDTASDVLKRIAPERHGDVWLLEPSNGLPVPGLRCFSGEPELAADLWLNIFRGLFSDSWGVRSERYLRLAFTTLANDAGASVADAPRLFGDARYRRRLVGALTDPLLLGQWAEFEALGSAQRAEHLASPLGKVSELVGRRVVRSVLAQAEPKLTIRDAIERGRIIVVSLPPGRLGGPAAQLLGALAVYEVFGTIMARQALAPERRRPMGFYIDEPAVLGSLPVPLDSLFETARGMGCGLTIAAQSLSQLPTAVQRAATTNAATIAAFRPGAEDAARVARELPGLTAEQLQQLDPYTVALRLGVAPGQVAPVCTVRALPLPEAVGDANALRRISSERYGTDPAAVDAALRARHDLEDVASSSDNDAASSGSASSPLGERRRAS
jgi:hypothetical protein